VSAFKAFKLSCVPLEQAAAVFHSSGTTGSETSRHYLDDVALQLYEASLSVGFEKGVSNPPKTIWALMPSPQAAPNSSLSYMLERLGAERFFFANDRVLTDSLHDLTHPITLFGTAFAFASLFDGGFDLPQLPVGSVIVETGGFKGRTREIPRAELYSLFTNKLGVDPDRCFSEYGMCEMASQFYGVGPDPVKRAPHWVRSRIIDPVTGTEAAPGEVGVLVHYDLANFNSVIGIETRDQGRWIGDGFELHGRVSESELRGCSLTAEDMWLRIPA
jgi:hypothetical protein